MKVKVFNRLAFKLIIAISILLLSALSVYTFYTIRLLKHDMTNIIHARSNDISEVIRKSTRYSMLLNRYDDVYEIMRTIGTESGVEKIRLYSKTGEIMFSTDTVEIATKADLKAEACNVCHGEAILSSNVPTANKMRIYVNPDGHQVLGVISPIKNEPDCYTADCHAHPKEKEVLGVLDVVLSMKDLERVVASSQRNIIISSLIITLVIAGFSGLFIALWVNVPVKRLNEGMKEIGEGNLDFKIEVKSHDELSKMAKQFNQMSGNLKTAYDEIKDWNEKLNDKVNAKTEELKNIYSLVIQIEKLASLGKLSATVAHELNNPLEGILTYSKLISKKLQKIQKDKEYEALLEHLSLIS
ncbi:MAG TPA: HAMP domain-containing protein, partial [Ignavibacteriales bacterium]|nr:HAMP domain-containing protein [Ignavibacteriales bacterium]